MRLSKSGIGLFMRCPKAWGYNYIDNRVGRGEMSSADLVFGTTFHDSVEQGKDCFPGANLSKANIIIGSALYHAYGQIYDPPGKRCEEKFEIQLTDDVEIVGVFDEVCEDYIRETKTSRSRIDDSYWEVLPLNAQVNMYLWAANKLGIKADYMMWDLVKRPMLRIRRGDTLEQFKERIDDYVYENRSELFQRTTVKRSPEQLSEFEDELRAYAALIKTNVYPKNGDSCRAFGRLCEYHPVCIGESKLSNDELYQVKIGGK